MFTFDFAGALMAAGICLLLLLATIVKAPKIVGTLIAIVVLAGLAILCLV